MGILKHLNPTFWTSHSTHVLTDILPQILLIKSVAVVCLRMHASKRNGTPRPKLSDVGASYRTFNTLLVECTAQGTPSLHISASRMCNCICHDQYGRGASNTGRERPPRRCLAGQSSHAHTTSQTHATVICSTTWIEAMLLIDAGSLRLALHTAQRPCACVPVCLGSARKIG